MVQVFIRFEDGKGYTVSVVEAATAPSPCSCVGNAGHV